MGGTLSNPHATTQRRKARHNKDLVRIVFDSRRVVAPPRETKDFVSLSVLHMKIDFEVIGVYPPLSAVNKVYKNA